MTSYELRPSPAIEALLWRGDNLPEAQAFFAGKRFLAQQEPDSKVLVVSDFTRATRWFIRPGYFFFIEGNSLRTTSREDFEKLYKEAP